MEKLANDIVELAISDDGLSIAIEDRRRGATWLLDTAHWGYDTQQLADSPTCSPLTPFDAGQTARNSERELQVTYSIPGGQAIYRWRLLDDGLAVTLNVQSEQVQRIALPGSFRAAAGKREVLIPRNQGALLRENGPSYGIRDRYVMLSMCAYLGDRGALVSTLEGERDRLYLHGRGAEGLYCLWELNPCEVEGWYEREVRLYPCDSTITAVAKRHRRRVVERGQLVTWEEKIRRKPIVEKMFGALIAFIGYNQSRQLDYVAAARTVRAAGFEAVLYCPVRFNALSLNFRMGGDPPIRLSDAELRGMQGAGGILAPWSWVYDGLDDGTQEVRRQFRVDRHGQFTAHWQMDDDIFNKVCTPYQIEFMRKQLAGDMREMGYIHYDVNGIRGGEPCFSHDHALHGHRPVTAREDQLRVQELLGAGVNGNRLVGSEGFNESFTPYYDIGTQKYDPSWGDAHAIPVPLTMLVFHDSTVHQYWELHTYNLTPGFQSDDGIAHTGAGRAEKKAAMDALYGSPPQVFPFGRQYYFPEGYEAHKTASYDVHVEDAEVARALRAALPVARLHKEIGKHEMLSFDFVTEDYAVQTSLFADGTRIVANISDEEKATPAYGRLPANSWKRT